MFWGPTPKKKCEIAERSDTADQGSLTEALDANLELSALCDLLGEETVAMAQFQSLIRSE